MEIILLIPLFAALWVLHDAKNRNMSTGSAIIWSIGTFALLIIFLPLYLLSRPQKQQQSIIVNNQTNNNRSLCPHCGKYYEGNAAFCPLCGQSVQAVQSAQPTQLNAASQETTATTPLETIRKCDKCGNTIPDGYEKCFYCN
mgnify:CR=1 FL=1